MKYIRIGQCYVVIMCVYVCVCRHTSVKLDLRDLTPNYYFDDVLSTPPQQQQK